jgi:hypothetical protein
MTAHEKEANQHGTHEDGGKKAKMAPQTFRSSRS